jgi:steroid delta-isomerase-like uncharacterized protein
MRITTEVADHTMPNPYNRKKILTNFVLEVWNNSTIEACEKYLGSTYTIHHDPGDQWHRQALSLEKFKERVRSSRAPFPDQCFTIQELFEDGNAVVMTWLWEATHKGDYPGFPASGKKISMSGATVYYFEGSRITGHWQITDRLGVYQQLMHWKKFQGPAPREER